MSILHSCLIGALGAVICYVTYHVIVFLVFTLVKVFKKGTDLEEDAPQDNADSTDETADDASEQKRVDVILEHIKEYSNAAGSSLVNYVNKQPQQTENKSEDKADVEESDEMKQPSINPWLRVIYIASMVVLGAASLLCIITTALIIYSWGYTSSVKGGVLVVPISIVLITLDFFILKSMCKKRPWWNYVVHTIVFLAMCFFSYAMVHGIDNITSDWDMIGLRRVISTKDITDIEKVSDEYYKEHDSYPKEAIDAMTKAGCTKGQVLMGDYYYTKSLTTSTYEETYLGKDEILILDRQNANGSHSILDGTNRDFSRSGDVEYLKAAIERSKENIQHAYYWWKKSAEGGDARGLYRMGCCYAKIYRINQLDKDLAKAYYYWKKSAEKGYGMAYKRLGDLLGTWEYMDAIQIEWSGSSDSTQIISNDSIKTYGIRIIRNSDEIEVKQKFLLPKEWQHDIKQARKYWQQAVDCNDDAKEEAERALQKVYPEEE